LGRRFWLVYLSSSASLHALWELAHSPLYTLWHFGSFEQIASDIAQCTVGDVLIAGAAVFAGRWVSRRSSWAIGNHVVFAIATVLAGILLTVAIESASVHLLGRWVYDPEMPLLPIFLIGISPLLQWLIVPAAVLWLTFRAVRVGNTRIRGANF
jgi:hypothetical protein